MTHKPALTNAMKVSIIIAEICSGISQGMRKAGEVKKMINSLMDTVHQDRNVHPYLE